MDLHEQLKFIRDVIDNEHGGVFFDGEENVEPDWDAITMYLEAGINPPAKDTRYNGWANYATWRVNLEIIDDIEPAAFDADDVSELADAMKAYVEEIVEETASGIASDYANAFISDVNWYEIAEAFAESNELFQDDEEEEEE